MNNSFRFCLLSGRSQHEGKLKACLSASQASEGLIFRQHCRTAGAHGKRASAAAV